MKIPAIAALLVSLLALPGCSNAIRSAGIEATDMSPIQVGASRGSVEAVLGAPISSEKTDAGTIDTYKFSTGGAGGGDGPWRVSNNWDGTPASSFWSLLSKRS